MDRMSPLDATFLHVEDGITHMHIASCAIFEGPPPAYDDLYALIAGKLPLIPRYRQRVRFVPGALGRPVWVDDPHFNLSYHVRHTALPPPGSDTDLRNLMGRLMSQPLDRSRPLWETWVVEGVEGGHWAIISKVHHCMVDGISGTDLMAVVLDDDRDAAPLPADEWSPRPEPSEFQLVTDALLEGITSPYEMARRARAALRAPGRVVGELKEIGEGAFSARRVALPNTALSIEGPIGPHRRWAWARSSIDEVKVVRQGLGGTVNDVVLTAITKGFRDLLLGRGDPVDGVTVRTLVPVSVRTKGDHTYNNQVSGMIAELPVGISDPVERLESIKAQMAGLKDSHQAVAAGVLTNLAGFAPPVLFAAGLRTATLLLRRLPQRNVNTVTTNVPGPQRPLYACGREMLEYFPFVPLSQGVRVGVAILSYNGKLAFGVTGDWDTTEDLEVLPRGIEEGMRELRKLATEATAFPATDA
jgi:diacylglycerol O-acyltransferase / wax synthase